MLERREQIVDVRRRLWARVRAPATSKADLAQARRKARGEFAVTAVEQKDRSAYAEPQHIDEIVRLLRIELHVRAGGERLIDVETGGSEIGSGHALR